MKLLSCLSAQRCWHAYEDTFGFENSITLQRANRLAEVYHEQRQYTKEVLILRTITAAFEAQLGPTDTKTLDELKRLAIALKHLGSFAEAEQLLTRVLAAKEAQDGPNSRPAVLILNRLAQLRDSQGRHVEAETEWNRPLSIVDARPGFSGKDKLDLLWYLGCNYVEQGKLTEAVPILDQVWKGLLEMGKSASEAFVKLVRVYERLGATEKVEEMRKISETILWTTKQAGR